MNLDTVEVYFSVGKVNNKSCKRRRERDHYVKDDRVSSLTVKHFVLNFERVIQ